MGRNVEPQPMDRARRRAFARGGAPAQERGAFGGGQARDPGADDVDDVKLKNFAQSRRRRAGMGNEGTKLFEGSHGQGDSADKLVANFRLLQRTDRTIVFKGISFCQNGEAKHPNSMSVLLS